ncbi:transcriptional regulator [Chromatiales bacterium (ex Bugula neritina AB1)]|nr:transcriptional regulator [Chromatiales bacterium (ex Bugula neritina AB1)]
MKSDGGESAAPPATYEELTRTIHEKFSRFSPTNQRIAVYITQNPNNVPVLSVAQLAEQCGSHASSFVRFAQQLGYQGFKELQQVYKARLATAAPGFDARIDALKSDLQTSGKGGAKGFLADLVVRDITSLEDLLADIAEEDLQHAVALLDSAETIYLLGQLRSEPIVALLRYILTMLGRRTVLLDCSGGLATHIAQTISAKDVLLTVSFRFYATEVVNVTEKVAEQGVPIIAISDSTLSPLAKSATVLFSIPEHEYTFSRSLAAPMCLAQALTVALAAQQQSSEDSPPRIPFVTQR